MQRIGVQFNDGDTVAFGELKTALANITKIAVAAMDKPNREAFLREIEEAYAPDGNQGHPHSQQERAGGPDRKDGITV
jgi:hypothetical protein